MNQQMLVGLMSGTSMDGIDAVLVRCGPDGVELVDCHEQPMTGELRRQIHELSHPGPSEIERLGTLDRLLGNAFAEAANKLLAKAGVAASQVSAIGSHGQTVRHHPPSSCATGEIAFSLQIGDPNTIAERTGITTVADFRRRDIAAGGEGAPLVPAFHAAAFSAPGKVRAIVNIGGIANVTVLNGEDISGFDSGPGNTLMDHWTQRHQGRHYDANGAWAAECQVNPLLLEALCQHPFLSLPPPKSTGKEAFNMAWLDKVLTAHAEVSPGDVQATLAEFTALTICESLASVNTTVDEVYVCGGGAANINLMRRLYKLLQPVPLGTTAEIGCDPAWVEATAFAWLAWRALEGLEGNVPQVTGASGARILGGIYPGLPAS